MRTRANGGDFWYSPIKKLWYSPHTTVQLILSDFGRVLLVDQARETLFQARTDAHEIEKNLQKFHSEITGIVQMTFQKIVEAFWDFSFNEIAKDVRKVIWPK